MRSILLFSDGRDPEQRRFGSMLLLFRAPGENAMETQ